MPNPFDKPKAGKKAYAYGLRKGPAVRKGPKAGVDTRPTEREPKRVAPRQRMPKELAPMPPRRGGRLTPRPMPMPRGPKGDGPKARPMPMPRGPSKRIKPRPMPKGLKDMLKRKP
jgi:hypothetical protein